MSSPGVITREFDLTLNTNTITTNASAMVGVFRWGPVEEPVTITTNESELVTVFGPPDTETTVSFHSAQNYLLYTNPLIVTRVVETTARNAYPTGEAVALVKNFNDYQSKISANTGISFIGRYPGAMGNAIEVSCANATGFTGWAYEDEFDFVPEGTDFHCVVVDGTGAISGTAGTILERFHSVSKTAGAKRADGTSAYIRDVIESQSNWVWLFDEDEIIFTATGSVGEYEVALQGGVDANDPASVSTAVALDLLSNSETIQFVAIFDAGFGSSEQSDQIDLCETRSDAVAFNAPELSDVFNVASSTALTNVASYFNTTLNRNSSYGFSVDNWKMVYDKYQNTMIWIPCTSDAAALYASLENPWESPAGTDRGQLKNVVKLAWNPNKAQRDALYRDSINSIVAFAGEGTVLFGDKTMLKRASGFSRINVRSLFNVLKKSIAVTGRAQLFQINDFITRSIFRNSVDRYLDTVQARRGVTRKLVVCDETNNTPQVIDANEFVGSIYIAAPKSINTVKLAFIATDSGVNFTEIEGQGFGF